MLFGIGFPELMVLALLGLVVFGPERLPDMAAKAARGVKALRAMASNAIRELNIESATVTKAIGDLQSLSRGSDSCHTALSAADLLDLMQDVGREEDRAPVRRDLAHDAEDLLLHHRIEPGRGLIED